MDKESAPPEKAINGIREIPRELLHPGAVWCPRDPGDHHLSCSQVDDKQNRIPHEAAWCPDLHREQIGGRDRVPVGHEER